MGITSILRLDKTYNQSVKVLDNTNFKIHSGTIYCLLGENGAGKTTLLKCLAGIIKADRLEMKSSYNKDHLFFYFDDKTFFLDYLTGRENIYLICKLKDIPIAIADKVIKESKIESFVDKLVLTYSKGMIEQLKITVALIIKPEILLLDEPFSSLDVLNYMKVKQSLQEYIYDDGHAVIISTHLISIAYEISDKILFLKNGNIEEIDHNVLSLGQLEDEIIKRYNMQQ